jgi:lysozyme family protein
MSVSLPALIQMNAHRWAAMHVSASRAPVVDEVAARLVEATAKASYQTVEAVTDVPWYVTAVIHEREASQSWTASLAQGDPWNKVSIHVPKGIGPFGSWAEAAEYTFKECAPRLAQWQNWTIGGLLTALEEYNGLGYAARGLPSPYVWACTDQYSRGKYVADGHYDPNAIDMQIGCGALLARMALIDVSVKGGIGAT